MDIEISDGMFEAKVVVFNPPGSNTWHRILYKGPEILGMRAYHNMSLVQASTLAALSIGIVMGVRTDEEVEVDLTAMGIFAAEKRV